MRPATLRRTSDQEAQRHHPDDMAATRTYAALDCRRTQNRNQRPNGMPEHETCPLPMCVDAHHDKFKCGKKCGNRLMGKSTAKFVKTAPPSRHGDGRNLYLLVQKSGSKSWVLRYQNNGNRHGIGLGSLALTKSVGPEALNISPPQWIEKHSRHMRISRQQRRSWTSRPTHL